MYSSKMLGCVSLKNFGFEHSENQIWEGILPIFDILPLGGHYLGGDTKPHGVVHIYGTHNQACRWNTKRDPSTALS